MPSKEDIDSLFEYMRVLASQQLNPLVMPPDMLGKVLEQVQEGIRSNARLCLSENPNENIWAYYNIKVTPIVLEDHLMVILTITQIDLTRCKSLQSTQPAHVTSKTWCPS